MTDGHGSNRGLVSAAGTVTQTFNYDAFGGALNFTPATTANIGTIFLFGGDAVYDPVSGLYLHGDGVRDVSGFEFIQRDPTNGSNSDPISLHKYLYANCDPICVVDPSGHDGEVLGTLAAIGIGEAIELGATNPELEQEVQDGVVAAGEELSAAVDGLAEDIANNVPETITQLQQQQAEIVENQQADLKDAIDEFGAEGKGLHFQELGDSRHSG